MIEFLVACMLLWAPTTPRAHAERLARDVESVVASEPALFEEGTLPTALLVLSTAAFESGYRMHTRGDHGKAFCMMQVHPGPGLLLEPNGGFSYNARGWQGRDLERDPRKCIRAALHMMRVSVEQCGNLSLYTFGRCKSRDPKGDLYLRKAFEAFDQEGPHVD